MILPILDSLSPEARSELEAFIRTEVERLFSEWTGDDWLTVNAAAEVLHTTPTAIRRRIAKGQIPVHRQGSRVYIKRSELMGGSDERS